jgi:hypothetical protein
VADLPAYDPKFEDRWAVSQHGALAHYMKGNMEIYAPGEAIQTEAGPFIVQPAMTEDDVFGLNWGQSLKKIATALLESSSLSIAEEIELARKEGAEVTVVEKGPAPGRGVRPDSSSLSVGDLMGLALKEGAVLEKAQPPDTARKNPAGNPRRISRPSSFRHSTRCYLGLTSRNLKIFSASKT